MWPGTRRERTPHHDNRNDDPHDYQPLAWQVADPSTNPRQPMETVLLYDPEDDQLWVELRHAISGTPEPEWCRRRLAWTIPSTVDASSLTDAINRGEIADALSRIRAGHTIEWDGSNHVGRLTDDAREMQDGIEEWLDAWRDTLEGGLIAVDDWYPERDLFIDDYGITATTTDAELDAIAERMEADARGENYALDGAYAYAERVRDELRDAASDDE